MYPDDREECARQGRAAAAGEISHFQLEERLVRRSGEPIWVSINVSPVRGQDGQVLYTLGIIESIEERRRAEEALQQANKLLEQRIEERTRQLSASRARLREKEKQKAEERRTLAVMNRRFLDAETAADLGRLDMAAIERVREHLAKGKPIDPRMFAKRGLSHGRPAKGYVGTQASDQVSGILKELTDFVWQSGPICG